MQEPSFVPLSDFVADERNANKGNLRGAKQIEASLRQHGAGRSILVDKHGKIIAGNKTAENAAAVGIEDCIVVETTGEQLVVVRRTDLDINDAKARELAIADNRSAELNLEWDAQLLQELMGEGVDLSQMWNEEELNALLASVNVVDVGGLLPGADPDAIPEEVETRCKPGDLWQLGRHRLLCGDSTVITDVQTLFGEDTAEMVWTDPPYGVAIGDKNKFLNSIARSNRVEENLTNDKQSEDGLMQMLRDCFSNAVTICTAGAAWYVAAPAVPLHVLFGSALKELGIWHQTIQWVKNNATFSPMGVDYHWQAEPIFYGWVPNAAHRFRGGRKQTTVWEIDRPLKSPEHPTMKPVELVARAIQNSSDAGHIVYDPFLGSGTTLIASQQEGRTCYGIEISPKYCDVILTRWEKATGKTATLMNVGRVSALAVNNGASSESN